MASRKNSHRESDSAHATLPINPEKVGRPRLIGPYAKLISRFYESLFLLKVLGQTRARHTPGPASTNGVESWRRRLLQNLSYICDFEKGGVSCTAIGLEDGNASYNFWVASNAATGKVAPFLESVLRALKDVPDESPKKQQANEEAILRLCVAFATPRIKKDLNTLQRAVKDCQKKLQMRDTDRDQAQELAAWLQSIIHTDDYVALCLSAYSASKSHCMRALTAEARAEERQAGLHAKRGPFASARHYIGRLGYHICAHNDLLQDASNLAPLLEAAVVRVIDPVPSVPQPQPDSHTTLPGILNRMGLTRGDPERLEIEQALIRRNDHFHIFQHFMEEFANCKPTVHAEVQVLEHFYNNNLKFAANDRYVGCSKAACLCCRLYFQYHPARMVIPGSHEKVWTSWGPPLVAAFQKHDQKSDRQRDILIKINQQIRTDAISQILRCSHPAAWHPDSQSGMSDIIASHNYYSSSMESVLSRTGTAATDYSDSLPSTSPSSAQTGDNVADIGSHAANFNPESDNGDGGVYIGDMSD